jgi:hypothetical protein
MHVGDVGKTNSGRRDGKRSRQRHGDEVKVMVSTTMEEAKVAKYSSQELL